MGEFKFPLFGAERKGLTLRARQTCRAVRFDSRCPVALTNPLPACPTTSSASFPPSSDQPPLLKEKLELALRFQELLWATWRFFKNDSEVSEEEQHVPLLELGLEPWAQLCCSQCLPGPLLHFLSRECVGIIDPPLQRGHSDLFLNLPKAPVMAKTQIPPYAA